MTFWTRLLYFQWNINPQTKRLSWFTPFSGFKTTTTLDKKMMWASILRQLLSFVLTHGSCLAGDRWHPHLHTIKTLRDCLTYSVCGLQMSWISGCRSSRLALSLHYLLRDWSFWQAYQNPSSFDLEAAGYLKQNPSFHKVSMKVYVADISQPWGVFSVCPLLNAFILIEDLILHMTLSCKEAENLWITLHLNLHQHHDVDILSPHKIYMPNILANSCPFQTPCRHRSIKDFIWSWISGH